MRPMYSGREKERQKFVYKNAPQRPKKNKAGMRQKEFQLLPMAKSRKKSAAPRETKRFLIRRSKENIRKPRIAKRQGENNSDITRMRAIQKKAKSQKKKRRICIRSERTNLENNEKEDFLCVVFIVLILCVDS